MKQKDIEKNALFVSTITNFIITLAGVWVYWTTGIQALFLDCVFSLIAFVSTIIATFISKKSQTKLKAYPKGLHFLEPLYAILKSLLILSLLSISFIATFQTAYEYFFNGIGDVMNTEPVLPYTFAMVVLCFGLGIYNKRQNSKINNTSTILTAESKGNFIDGLQSLGIGMAVLMLYFVDKQGALGFLWYTGDFFITAILVIISIKEPITVFISSFKELSKGLTNDKQISSYVNGVVNECINTIVKESYCEIIKVGMYIDVKIIIKDDISQDTYNKLKKARGNIYNELIKEYENISISYEF